MRLNCRLNSISIYIEIEIDPKNLALPSYVCWLHTDLSKGSCSELLLIDPAQYFLIFCQLQHVYSLPPSFKCGQYLLILSIFFKLRLRLKLNLHSTEKLRLNLKLNSISIYIEIEIEIELALLTNIEIELEVEFNINIY